MSSKPVRTYSDVLEDRRRLESIDRLRMQIADIGLSMDSARAEKNRDAWDGFKVEREAAKAELLQLVSERDFANVVPLEWTHKASDQEIEARIFSEALKGIASERVTDRNIMLLGPSKLGKSAALALMLRRKMRESYTSAQWYYSRALCAAPMRHALGTGEAPELIAAAGTALLVLDDVGVERDHGPLLDVIHERYEKNRITWCSSGLNVAQLHERYGEAIVRRLVECNGQPGRVVSCFSKAST